MRSVYQKWSPGLSTAFSGSVKLYKKPMDSPFCFGPRNGLVGENKKDNHG